jgi:hypothetical protein
MTPHKHAAVIKAWADGAEIEYNNTAGKWISTFGHPTWNNTLEYRVKPVPVVEKHSLHMKLFKSYHDKKYISRSYDCLDNLELTFTDGVLTGAKVLK